MRSVPAHYVRFLWAALSLVLSCALVFPTSSADELPLRRVVLYSAGVGFFEHEGPVQGDRSIDMTFDVSEINDLLKSLVVQDFGQGVVSSVTYGSRDPVAKTLRTFAVDLTDPPTVADLLTQVRGHRVSVEADEIVEGTVLGVEIRTQIVGDQAVRGERLNLLTPQGIQSLELNSLRAVKLLDPTLDDEMRQALALIAQSRRQDQKQVRIELRGEGERQVRIGYIREAPVWKISYRLVLDEDQPSFLQGWAIVENTTDQDWTDVRLKLMSGRPVSFLMELYEPLFVQRPTVMPDLGGQVAPRVYGRGFTQPSETFGGGESGGLGGMMGGGLGGGFGGGGMGGFGGGGMGGFGGAGMGGFGGGDEAGAGSRPDDRLDLAQSVAAAVAAEAVGDLFQYDIELPVRLDRNQSAMLPIVNQSVQGEKLAIFNQSVHEKHPMNGLRLTNITDLHLMQGPITVFDAGVYAGDAQVRDLAPGASRLISYALDLDTEIVVTRTDLPKQLAAMHIANGIVDVTYHLARASHYLLNNESPKQKQLIIEHPIDSEYALQSRDALAETTRDLYRFAVDVQPGTTMLFDVQERKTRQEKLPLDGLDDVTIMTYHAEQAVSDPVKVILNQLVTRRRELTQVAASLLQIDEQIREATSWQAQVRENMKALDKSNKLYQQYVEDLADKEALLATWSKESSELQLTKRRLDAELEKFVRQAKAP